MEGMRVGHEQGKEFLGVAAIAAFRVFALLDSKPVVKSRTSGPNDLRQRGWQKTVC